MFPDLRKAEGREGGRGGKGRGKPCARGSGRGRGMGTKIFSNHWKNGEKFFQWLEKTGKVFQPLEKKFPIIGKIAPNFPTIGKIFSNHWKIPEGAAGRRIGRGAGIRAGIVCPGGGIRGAVRGKPKTSWPQPCISLHKPSHSPCIPHLHTPLPHRNLLLQWRKRELR